MVSDIHSPGTKARATCPSPPCSSPSLSRSSASPPRSGVSPSVPLSSPSLPSVGPNPPLLNPSLLFYFLRTSSRTAIDSITRLGTAAAKCCIIPRIHLRASVSAGINNSMSYHMCWCVLRARQTVVQQQQHFRRIILMWCV